MDTTQPKPPGQKFKEDVHDQIGKTDVVDRNFDVFDEGPVVACPNDDLVDV